MKKIIGKVVAQDTGPAYTTMSIDFLNDELKLLNMGGEYVLVIGALNVPDSCYIEVSDLREDQNRKTVESAARITGLELENIRLKNKIEAIELNIGYVVAAIHSAGQHIPNSYKYRIDEAVELLNKEFKRKIL